MLNSKPRSGLGVLKIRFIDGAQAVLRDCVEYTNGMYYFFVVQRSIHSEKEDTISFKLIDIESVERKTASGEFKEVKLRKIKSKSKDVNQCQ